MKKILLSGLLASIAIFIVSMILSVGEHYFLPSLIAEYKYSNMFRLWTDPIMTLYFVSPFIYGFLLAYVWDKVKIVSQGQTILHRGLVFGSCFWLVSTVPGMWITYSSFRLSLLMVSSWAIMGLVELIAASLVVVKFNK